VDWTYPRGEASLCGLASWSAGVVQKRYVLLSMSCHVEFGDEELSRDGVRRMKKEESRRSRYSTEP
jgi:hypothetical protein